MMIFCDYCGGRLPPSALKCANCGAPVTRSALISAERPAPELSPVVDDVAELCRRRPVLIAGAVAALFMLYRK